MRRSSDRRLERVLGGSRALAVIFRTMARMYRPEHAAGFAGDLRFVLARAGDARTWTVHCAPEGATAEPGAHERPALTLELGLADFLRLAAGELDPVKALLGGRLELDGDFGVALRLAAMFGQRSG